MKKQAEMTGLPATVIYCILCLFETPFFFLSQESVFQNRLLKQTPPEK